jgi:hypothetical protein
LQKITGVVDFIRSGDLCEISTSLVKNYRSYVLYKTL